MPPPVKCRVECPQWQDDGHPSCAAWLQRRRTRQLLSCARSILAEIMVAQANCSTMGTRPRPVPKKAAREARVPRFRGSPAPWAPRAPLSFSHPPPRKPSLTPRSGLALVACRVPAGGDGGALYRHPFQLSWRYCRRPRMQPKTATAHRLGRRMTPTGHGEWRIHDRRTLNRGSAGEKPAVPIWRHGPVGSAAGLALLAGSASQQIDRRRLGQSQRPST
jgi:hypothetical protein